MRTPISYYGGKSRIASQIVQYIWEIPHTVYAEPFAGGLSVLYEKGLPHRSNEGHYREVINDTNKNLITFWRVARENPEELARWIQLTPYSQEEHRQSMLIYKNPAEYSELKIAWATYIQCNASFSSQIGRGWGTSIINQNKAASWANLSARLPECFDRLRKVHIGCEDALDFIKRWNSPQTLFYLDPPYPGTDQGHYSGYTIDDFAALCKLLDESRCSYILSNYHQKIAPESAQRLVEIATVMSASKNKDGDKKRVEKIWICDRSSGMRSDLAALVAPKPKQLQLFGG